MEGSCRAADSPSKRRADRLPCCCCRLLLLPQGEDADEARERPSWMLAAEGEGDATSPAASGLASASGLAGSASLAGSAAGTATAAAASAGAAGGAADLLDLLGA